MTNPAAFPRRSASTRTLPLTAASLSSVDGAVVVRWPALQLQVEPKPAADVSKVLPTVQLVTGAGWAVVDGPAPARTTGQPLIQSRRSISRGRRVRFKVAP